MGAVFISYRRGDASGTSGRLFDRLQHALGRANVFMDVDSIEPGLDFVEVLNRHLEHCEVMLVVMGPAWLTAVDQAGRRRIDDEDDFVRMEIGTALARGIRVIPVVVDGAHPVGSVELPEDLKLLSRRQALVIRHDRFGADVDQLIETLIKIVGPSARAPGQQSLATPSRVDDQQLARIQSTIEAAGGFPGLYKARYLSPAQEDNIRLWADVLRDVRVLALIDLHERDGRDGIALTDHGVFVRARNGACSFVAFAALDSSRSQKLGLNEIGVGPLTIDGTGSDRAGVVAFLNDVADAFGGRPRRR
ncbi:MAG: toll/interleukin-1 receptor domain-containing protein [Hyphomonadaceae bacterium]